MHAEERAAERAAHRARAARPRLALLALLLALAAGAAFAAGGDAVPGTGSWPLFVAGYALGTLAFVPKPALTAAAGAAFGAAPGIAVAAAGTALGALLAFGAARLLGRDAVGPLLARHRATAALEERLARRPFTGVLVLRLVPVMPFAAVNLGAGVCRVGWLPFTAATLIGTLPGNAAYALAGAAAAAPASPALWSAAALALALTACAALWRRGRLRAARQPAGSPAGRACAGQPAGPGPREGPG
ncbi:hypothetical protein CAG99_15095 [Streptomyces marincola]|uniref:TVP38/TMEM64 family membrane protein n=1 Tax=Streptomyces marincola TaxID=2878388 RepID=A0A1W7D5R1_9ACTN|nr:hypothetical protein CAG99_15095 [Streptomyces marincola]